MPRASAVEPNKRREQIINAAIACFARDGFHNTTIDDISTYAKLGKGTIYRYFKSKDEIILATTRETPEEGERYWAEAFSSADVAVAIDAYVSGIVRKMSTRYYRPTQQVKMQLYAEACRDKHVRGLMEARWTRPLERLTGAIKDAQRRGEINPDLDPESSARLLGMTMFLGFLVQSSFSRDIDVDSYLKTWRALLQGNFWTNKKTPPITPGRPRSSDEANGHRKRSLPALNIALLAAPRTKLPSRP